MLKRIMLLGIGISLLLSCETKFSVNGDYKEQPVVHFLLNQGEDYQFLKLNKTFLKEGNAKEFAKQAELSYFDEVDAVVEEVIGGNVNRSWTLKDTTITNKKEGAFYGPEQKLYYFKVDAEDENEKLNEDALYRLKIDIDNGAHTVEGSTNLVKGVKIKYPLKNMSVRFAEFNVAQNGYRNMPITYDKSPEAAIFNVKMKIDYKEYQGSNSEVKSILWNIGERENASPSASSGTFFATGERFYQLLKKEIPVDENVTRRQLDGLEIILTAGSRDLYTYMLTNEPSSSLAQNKPTYSNVDGALGIFSARVTIRQYKPDFTSPQTRGLDQNSTKELCNGTYTNLLDFCSPIP